MWLGLLDRPEHGSNLTLACSHSPGVSVPIMQPQSCCVGVCHAATVLVSPCLPSIHSSVAFLLACRYNPVAPLPLMQQCEPVEWACVNTHMPAPHSPETLHNQLQRCNQALPDCLSPHHQSNSANTQVTKTGECCGVSLTLKLMTPRILQHQQCMVTALRAPLTAHTSVFAACPCVSQNFALTVACYMERLRGHA